MNEQEIRGKIEGIENQVLNKIKEYFPASGMDLGDTIVNIEDIKFERPKLFDLEHEIDVKDRGGSLLGSVKGVLVVKDKKTGKVTSKSNPRTIVTIPYLTNRGTYIIGGKEKVISKQMRLKPGVYTYDKNSKVETLMFLERGKNLYFEFDPEETNLKVTLDGRNTNAIIFLRILGITDAEISAVINDKKIEAPLMRKAQNKNMDAEISKLWGKLPCRYWHENGKYPGKQEAIEDIRKYFFNICEFGETGSKVMNVTLGHSSYNPDKQVFLRALAKIMQIARAESQEERDELSDDRDDIRFQNILADEDQISFYVQEGLENLQKDLRSKSSRGKSVIDSFSYHKISDPLTKFMSKGQLADLVEQTNPLHMSAAVRKITSLGEGGLRRETASQETRNLQNSSFGKVDPVETPESGKIGLVTHLSHNAKVKDLTIYSRYYKVANGKFQKVKSNEVELEPLSEHDKYIAFYDPNTFKIVGNTVTLPLHVTARHKGNIETNVSRNKIDYVDMSPNVIFGDATALIPFSAHNDGNRMLMGANMQKQALPLVNREVPLVQNATDDTKNETFEERIADQYSFLVKADAGGKVTAVTDKHIVITDKDGTKHEHKLMKYFPLNMSHYVNNEPVVSVGDTVKKGQLLAEGWQTRDGKLALGTNVRIAYMPWKGYNFEDGYVISESLAERMGTEELKVESIAVKEYQIGGPGSEVKQILNRLNVSAEQLDKLDNDGVIKEGEEVNTGTILVGIVEEVPELEDSPERKFTQQVLGVELQKQYKNKSEVIEGYLKGKVIRVKKIPQGSGDLKYIINVTIHMSSPLKEGDKLAGRHGNKGIITKIERDEDMPMAEDGKPVELIYSPLGVPSRKNLGQLYEVNAGLIAEKTGKPYKVFNFDKAEAKNIENKLKEIGFPGGKMTLYDPETGDPYDHKVTVGNAYIMKLKHKVDEKLQARNIGRINFVYNTPVKTMGERAGEKANPQKWGEMEMRALEASKAVNLIDEATRLKADAAGDEKKRAAIFHALTFGGVHQVAGDVPESLRIFKDYSTALGVNVKPLVSGKEVQSLDSRFNTLAALPLKDTEVKKLSRGEVNKAAMFAALVSGDQSEDGGLFDPKIFGATPDEQRTYWGHIKLAMPMPNPLLLTSNINPYAYLLDVKAKDIKTILTDKVGVVTNPGDTGHGKFQVLPIEEIEKLVEQDKTFKYEVSGNALNAMLADINVKRELQITQEALLEAKPKDKPKHMKKLRILRMLDENKLKPEDLMIKNLPVLPVGLRPFKKEAGSRQTLDDINKLYKDLIEVNNLVSPFSDKDVWEITETDTKYKLMKDYYERLENVMGVNTHPLLGPGGQEVKGIMKRMKEKDGLIRGRLMSKFLDYSGRSVITVNPSLGLDEAGVPVDIAKKLYEPFVVRELMRTGKARSHDEALEKAKDTNNQDTWDALQRVVENRPVILNRAPSLHKYSIQAFKPKLTKARAIELNPLVVTGFNADFDGDQMGVHVPLTDEAVKEAETLLMPSKNLINPTNGSLITPIKGEAILGLYYLTIDKNKGKMITKNMAKTTYNSYEQLLQDYKSNKLTPYDVIIFDNVPATVGQHLVNHHLPLEYRDYRRVLRQPVLSKLIEQMLSDEEKQGKGSKSGGIQAAVVALNRLKDIGFLAATKSAMSIGVFDLETVKDKDKILSNADEIKAKDPSKVHPVYFKVQ
jgi:DNA-directed RNA polymerase subunit beta